MAKKIFLVVIGALLIFFAGTTSTQADSTNLALAPVGTAVSSQTNTPWWGDTISNLNDGAWPLPENQGGDAFLTITHFDGTLPAKAYIKWDDPVAVENVVIRHYVAYGWVGSETITRGFEIQTLVTGGDPADEADWVTQDSVVGNTDQVTTHDLSFVVTHAVRIYITDPSQPNFAYPYGRIAEMEVWGFFNAPPVANVTDARAQVVYNNVAGNGNFLIKGKFTVSDFEGDPIPDLGSIEAVSIILKGVDAEGNNIDIATDDIPVSILGNSRN